MVDLVTDEDRRSIVARGIRLAFLWSTDRWVHSIEHETSGSVLARTIEGEPGSDDPSRVVSPAYQQLEFQASGPIIRALLVGQSGPHHFSAVFSVEEVDGGLEIVVDVADRCRSSIEFLACTYWVDLVSGDLIDADPRRIEWGFAGGRWTFSARDSASVHLSESGRRATRVQASAAIDGKSHTQRCIYEWGWRAATAPRRSITGGPHGSPERI